MVVPIIAVAGAAGGGAATATAATATAGSVGAGVTARVGASAVSSGFAKNAGAKMLSGGARRSMSGGDDLISFTGRGGIGNPNDAKQGKVMSDQLAGEMATKGIGMLGPKGMIAAKIIETVPGGKKLVGKIANKVMSDSPIGQVVSKLGQYRQTGAAKGLSGGMKVPGMSAMPLVPKMPGMPGK